MIEQNVKCQMQMEIKDLRQNRQQVRDSGLNP